MIDPLDRRINHRNFKQDEYPTRDVISDIIQDAINVSPIKGQLYINVDVWGPEHHQIKKDLVLTSGYELTGLKRTQDENLSDFEWEDKILNQYHNNPEQFNTQLEAPYLLALTEDKIENKPRHKRTRLKRFWENLGIFGYAVALTANKRGVDASYCSHYNMNYTTKFNKMCIDYKKKGKNVLFFLGLGYYDFYAKETNWKFVDEDIVEHRLGGRYNVKTRTRDGYKKIKQDCDTLVNWQ